jgi:type VI secretion system secreted protein VgrG
VSKVLANVDIQDFDMRSTCGTFSKGNKLDITPNKAFSSLQGFMEGYTEGLESSRDTGKQQQGKLFRQALLLLASPNGIALTTPEDIILQASQDIATSAQGAMNLSAQKNIVAHAQEKISLFAAQKGLRAFAAKGKIELQAQDDAIEAIARKVIKLISIEEKIEITSPKEIVLTAGGSQIKINAQGIFTTTGGKFESKAGQHSFVGGATVNAELPNIPTNKNYSNKLDLYHLFVGEKFLNIEYQYLDKNTNTYITGNLDEDGQTQDYFSDVQKEFDILVGYNSSEWLSDDDLSFDHVEEKDI